tara:strand:- start:17746 stop:18606 length:861 start_codon:yes stop_codon:yes gene_type:complete
MRIKKSNKNDYIRAGDLWIRNFTKPSVKAMSINSLCSSERELLIQNEMANTNRIDAYSIGEENFEFPFVVIVSDGYGFDVKQEMLSHFPEDVAVFAVNRALAKWQLLNEDIRPDLRRSINFYIANNPFSDCMSYLPAKNYYPSCVLSTRIYPLFPDKYYGNKFFYHPTPESGYGGKTDKSVSYYIDDYRNPVCAAIGLASQMRVRRLLLFCCDDSFEDERPGAEKLENGLWQYPQHDISHQAIDANLYWLSHQKDYPVKVGSFSAGKSYVNAPYIQPDKIMEFFTS